MNWTTVFYLITLGDSIKTLFIVISVITGVYFLFASIAALGAFDSQTFSLWERGNRRLYFIFTPLFFISLICAVAIPTKQDALLIVAGSAVAKFVTTDSSSKAIPADLTRYVHMALVRETEGVSDDVKREIGLPTETSKERLIRKAKDMTKEELLRYIQTDSTLSK